MGSHPPGRRTSTSTEHGAVTSTNNPMGPVTAKLNGKCWCSQSSFRVAWVHANVVDATTNARRSVAKQVFMVARVRRASCWHVGAAARAVDSERSSKRSRAPTQSITETSGDHHMSTSLQFTFDCGVVQDARRVRAWPCVSARTQKKEAALADIDSHSKHGGRLGLALACGQYHVAGVRCCCGSGFTCVGSTWPSWFQQCVPVHLCCGNRWFVGSCGRCPVRRRLGSLGH